MNFETHNDSDISVNGTSLRGHIRVRFSRLCEVFGEPLTGGAEDKVQAEWKVSFSDGTVATIYDWKRDGQPLDTIDIWNVGGKSLDAYLAIQEALNK